MKTLTRYALWITAIAALWTPLPSAAQNCSSFLGGLNTWLSTHQPDGVILATVTGVRSDTLVYYAEGPGGPASSGVLVYHPGSWLGNTYYPAYIQDESANGPLFQFFNDRRFSLPGDPPNAHPFDPSAVDQLGVKIYLESSKTLNITAGQTIFTLYSWGNGRQTMNGSCRNGVLYGFFGGSTLAAVTFTEFVIPG